MVTFYQVTFFHYRLHVYFSARFCPIDCCCQVKSNWSCRPTFVFESPLPRLCSLPVNFFNDDAHGLSLAPLVGTLMYVCPGFAFYWILFLGNEIWKTLREKFLFYRPTLASRWVQSFVCWFSWPQIICMWSEVVGNFPHPNPLSINLVHMCGLPESSLTPSNASRMGNRYLALRQALTQFVSFFDVWVFCLFVTCGLCPGANWGRGPC